MRKVAVLATMALLALAGCGKPSQSGETTKPAVVPKSNIPAINVICRSELSPENDDQQYIFVFKSDQGANSISTNITTNVERERDAPKMYKAFLFSDDPDTLVFDDAHYYNIKTQMVRYTHKTQKDPNKEECDLVEAASQQCATAGNINECMNIKYPPSTRLLSSGVCPSKYRYAKDSADDYFICKTATPAPTPSSVNAPEGAASPSDQQKSDNSNIQQASSPAAEATGLISPSFDCTKAVSGQEKMVCSDRDLAKLDVTLHGLYVQSRNKAADKKAVLDGQRAWIKQSFNACSNKACLVSAYNSRISELGN